MDVDLNGADIGTAAAEGRGEGEIFVFPEVNAGREDATDGPGDGVVVGMPTAPAVDRAGVHAGPATDTFEAVAEVFSAELFAAAVIDDNNMHLPTGLRSVVVAGIDGDGLAGGAARQ